MKYISKFGDKLWDAVGCPGFIFDGIRVYNSDGNYEESLFELPYGVIFDAIESTMFSLTESSKLGEDISCK